MERTRFVQHNGRPIVLMDFTGLHEEAEALVAIDEARRFVASQPRVRALLTLVDVSDSTYTPAIVDGLKALAKHDEPWMIASAVVGLNAFRRIALRIISLVTGRKFAVFTSQLDAMEWLARQKEPPRNVPDAEGPTDRPTVH